MNRKLREASEEYVNLVKEVANSDVCSQIGRYVDMKNFSMLEYEFENFRAV